PPLSEADVGQIGRAFNDQSSRSAPTPLSGMPIAAPVGSLPPAASMIRPYASPSMQRRAVRASNRRTVLAIATLGTIIGVLAAVLVTGSGDDDIPITDTGDSGSATVAMAPPRPAMPQPTSDPIETK